MSQTAPSPPVIFPQLHATEGDGPSSSPPTGAHQHIIVIGGGFAGIQTVLGLHRAAARVTLVDRRNFTLFQPLLYQVATGLLSPANIATPMRLLFAGQPHVQVVLGEVTGIELSARRVLVDGAAMDFDYLVVACGSRHHYFGNPQWERHAPGLKSLEDAEDIRRRIFLALERASRTADPLERERFLTFVVVGGGPTSVELAGAVAEIVAHAARSGLRPMITDSYHIILVEAASRLLGGFSLASSEESARALRSIGVEVRLQCRVIDVDETGVMLADDGGKYRISAATVLWGAGVQASPIATMLASVTGCTVARDGRIPVTDDCSIVGHPRVFALGDMASFIHNGKPLPGTAQVAMQQGDHVAAVISARMSNHMQSMPFRFRDRGNMATIGRRLAVADIGRLHLRGRIAWLTWLILHLAKLIRFENRLLVLIQWAWSYATWNRNASLITGEDPDRLP